ncbi:iron complex outermembrane receptor protein [Chromohalobacter marismortui]|uniref:Iron complex outermembrane receptor protein n=1 Tax=Chromohalobacter marismortui TaxID=42055 RepID=A0A4R7NMN8_9GAMM|nr:MULTISPECIES: TonB-dependent receptor [Chromohalobacter]MCI0509873.1 TonB-dependent receptor [Chromohalobacter sp.]MCI0591879.1 TonB-dependent receptor [Chromohalobacter sp.]TDU22095.1 iron complex outermembrane receptor protein [Chromohalobacter marismortui]
MIHRYLQTSLLLGALSVSGVAFSQSSAPEVMEVTAPRLDRELYATPSAVSVIDREDIARGQQRVRLDESLVTVPGVYLQNRYNFAQGERIAIRGFGARTPWGVRGITLMVDGIPYTLPDGQAQTDAIDLDSAQRIEVIRGPASVQYGNAAGGVISVTTATGRDDPGSNVRLGVGSNGYRKASVSNGGVEGPWSHHVSFSALKTDGYREHSAAEKYLFNGKLRREFGDDRALTAIVNLLDSPYAEDPGGMTRELVNEDREGTTDSAYYSPTRIDSGQEVDQQVIGLQYEDLDAGPGELYLKGFYLHRDYQQQLAYAGDDNFVAYERDYYGGSAEYHQTLSLGEMPLTYVAGVDVARQEDARYREAVSIDGVHQGRTAEETQQATSLGVFLQGDLDLTERWMLSLGARYDRITFDIDDHYFADASNPGPGDDSGERTFRQWSGSAGLSFRYLPTHQVYLSTGTSFETPTFSEFANPYGGGGFNPGIEPQKAWNREIGLRGHFANGLDYDVAVFSTRVRDSLVSYQGDDGRGFYRNAGKSHHEGIETSLGWQLTPRWRIDSALTLARYEYDDYVVNGNNYDGNRIPGLPEQTWINQLTWEGLDERFATLEAQYIGDMVADDANDVQVDDYWLVNLRAGDGWHLGGDTLLKGYMGIRNLFAQEHFANVIINATNERYFDTAPGRTVYAGMEVAF